MKQRFRWEAVRAIRAVADAMERVSPARLLGRAEALWTAAAGFLYGLSGWVGRCGCSHSDPKVCADATGGAYCECPCHGPGDEGGAK